MAELVLGPLLRHVGPDDATVWCETSAPCEVEVLGHRSRTFAVEGHHFAIVCVQGLEPGTTTPYEVSLDGERAWPPAGDAFPPCVIRTLRAGDPLVLSFGSCRVCVPNEPPYTLRKDDDPRGREVDALRELARRMMDEPQERWPHALLLLGDQVYADEVSPQARELIRARRDVSQPPYEEVADFEEYCALYRESWSEPVMRWLLSTVPSVMIFDDHDVHDDWNTSQAWVDEMRRKPWWEKRITGAFMSYWCFQHLGNLSPDRLADDDVVRAVHSVDDATDVMRDLARRADREMEGTRWSFRRELGSVRLVVIDSRAGRMLEPRRRAMVDDREWAWIEDNATGGCDHLLLGTSLPWLLSHGMHDLEAWNEAVCDGAWGRWAMGPGEKVRQALDLEHWAAFGRSFHALSRLVTEVAAGRRGSAPATIVALSGDVHHAYLTEALLPERVESHVWQAVCSPLRNPLDRRERRAIRIAGSRPGRAVGRVLARSARVPAVPLDWRPVRKAPWFDNQVATLTLEGRRAEMRLERTSPGESGLTEVFRHTLA